MHFKKLFDYSEPRVAAVTIFVVALAAMVWYVGQVVYDIKLASDTIEVTGSAKESVVADTARLVIHIETKTGLFDQSAGTARLAEAVENVSRYLKEAGLTDFETPAGSTNATYIYPQNAEAIQTGYTMNRTVVVRGTDVEKLSNLANDVGPLNGEGYVVTVGGLELTYSKLDDMRVKLLTEAIKDAAARAEAIASESGREVGLLRNAVGGVVQVLPQGGVDISDYGSYDTSSLNKEVMVTTRATFSLE
ncbi:MAG: SIMPL domain-containing protein [Candidatus Pacebacteria bacterium]|jgi:hypothetical protein|nr:SIMPL domain-containing protein [Candidatus Paceibacterota bacterium]